MKLIIMGAGYVGMALLKELHNSAHEIVVTTTQESKIENLKKFGQVSHLHPGADLTPLIASADGMVVLVAPSNSQNYCDTYLNTAKRISKGLENRQRPFYLLYTSSTSVCEGRQDWVTEETPLSPGSENGKILLETETLLLNSNATVCILRLGGIYGPGRDLNSRAKRLSGQKMGSNGEETTNHTHLDDIVAAITFCLDKTLSGVYHLVNDDHPTKKHLYNKLCQSQHLPLPCWTLTPAKGYKIANRKIKDAGFIFTHPHILE